MRTRLVISVMAVCGLVAFAGCSKSDTSTPDPTTSTLAPSVTLPWTSWMLVSYLGPDQAVVPAVAGDPSVLTFAPDGRLNGSTGCNGFGGTYTLDGQTLTLELGVMTQKACANPQVMAQEAALAQLLGQVIGFTQTSDALTLTASDGTTLLSYSPAGIR